VEKLGAGITNLVSGLWAVASATASEGTSMVRAPGSGGAPAEAFDTEGYAELVETMQDPHGGTNEEEAEVVAVLQQASSKLENPLFIEPYDDNKLPEYFVPPEALQPGEMVSCGVIDGPSPDEAQSMGLSASEVASVYQCTLTNGLRICLKHTDFKEDNIQFRCTAGGGISEVDLEEIPSCMQAVNIVEELGIFGIHPEVLVDMMAGKRISISSSISLFKRLVYGETSVADFECTCELLHALFTATYEPDPRRLHTILQVLREKAIHEQDDPAVVFQDRINATNSGHSKYYAPLTLEEIDNINCESALRFFRRCFQSPSEFTLVLVGNLVWETALPLFQKYLGSIPTADPLISPGATLRTIDAAFPDHIVREDVRLMMVEPQGKCSVALPIIVPVPELDTEEGKLQKMLEYMYSVELLCSVLQKEIQELLRFELGKIYNVTVGTDVMTAPLLHGQAIVAASGYCAIQFSCASEDTVDLVEKVLGKIEHIRINGFDAAQVQAVKEAERRSHEEMLLLNNYWLQQLAAMYTSPRFQGNVARTYSEAAAARQAVVANLDAVQLNSVFPLLFADANVRTVMTLSPKVSLLEALSEAPAAISKWNIWTNSNMWPCSVDEAVGEMQRALGPVPAE